VTLFEPDEPVAAELGPADASEPADPVDLPARRRVRLLVAYDGAPYRGFAESAGVASVAGTLRAAIERVIGGPVELTGAGRTDAGVHAWGQVVTFDGATAVMDLDRLQRSVNAICGPSIVVRAAEWAAPDFDARFSARWRRYRYTVLARAVPDPFLAGTAWHVERPIDLRLMALASDPLVGEHDFSSFCRRPRVAEGHAAPSLVRRVHEAGWSDEGDGLLRFEIRANAFCHQMVRSLVGLLVEVGVGRRRAGDVLGVLRARDRAAAGQLAPPHGLCLWEVGY
jgi:tRNA pseudouridine38-40 synthase